MVVPTTIRTTAHRDNPSRLGHLIIDLSQRRSHLVGESPGNDHNIGLTGGGAENNSHSILIVAGGGEMHHLDGAAGETEGDGPEGALAGPVRDGVERGAAGYVSEGLLLKL